MKSLFNKIGYKISEVEKIDTHGGSIRLYINKNQKVSNNSVENIIKEELDFGIDNINIYRKFENEIAQTKRNAVRNISKLKEITFECEYTIEKGILKFSKSNKKTLE
jgi:nucleoside-diphosphate-sugar epimerase